MRFCFVNLTETPTDNCISLNQPDNVSEILKLTKFSIKVTQKVNSWVSMFEWWFCKKLCKLLIKCKRNWKAKL